MLKSERRRGIASLSGVSVRRRTSRQICYQVEGWMGRFLAAEDPSVLAGAEPLDVAAQQGNQLGRERHVQGRPPGNELQITRASLPADGVSVTHP